MEVWIKNTKVSLTKSHYVASGGEGQIYAKDNIAYKIYTDPNKMIPVGKIQELAAITDNNVIKPQDVLLDQKKHPVGYSMRFIKNTYALCQLFTKAFRDREGITHDTARELVQKLHDIVINVHKASILIVDLNEMNFLVDHSFKDIFAIDVDSYKTKSFPATALMESVRDRHSTTFSEATDWFAFGIVAFQMMIGIHPYKGKHPSLKTFDERMQKNVSVFNKDVSVPKVCYSLDVIPQAYSDWFRAIFEDGKRVPPPSNISSTAVFIPAVVQKILGTNKLDINELYSVDGQIIDILFSGGNRAVLTDKKFYLTHQDFSVSSGVKIGLIPKTDHVILAKIDCGQLKVIDAVTKQNIPCNIAASGIMTYNGSVYVKQIDSIVELDLTEVGKKVLVSAKHIANVLENASSVYDGVVVQNLLGAYYVSIFPSPGVHQQVHIKELDKYRVVDAKFDGGVLMVVGTRTVGANLFYDRFVFRFGTDWQTYDVRKVENIIYTGLNFVTLDNGICVSLNEDDELEVFSGRKDSQTIKVIKDSVLGSDMRLFRSGMNLLFARGNKLYTMKMKP